VYRSLAQSHLSGPKKKEPCSPESPHDSILLLTNETLACYVGTNSPI
jgi:hypothetical protein